MLTPTSAPPSDDTRNGGDDACGLRVRADVAGAGRGARSQAPWTAGRAER